MQLPAIDLDSLSTIPALAGAYPQFLSETALRWQLRHRDENGLASACVRVGKKILISKPRYEAWLSTRAGQP